MATEIAISSSIQTVVPSQHNIAQKAALTPAKTDLATQITTSGDLPEEPIQVVVAGSLAMDLSCTYIPEHEASTARRPDLSTSNPAVIRQGIGGVGQNVSSVLKYLGVSVRLCSVVANDIAGSNALDLLKQKGLRTDGIHVSSTGRPSAQYVAVNDSQKNLVVAMADMGILEEVDQEFSTLWQPRLNESRPKWLVVDANWDPTTLRKWLVAARDIGARVAYEPVSVAKAKRIFSRVSQAGIDLMAVPNHLISIATPNGLELTSMHGAATMAGAFERADWWQIINSMGLPSSGSREKLTALTTAQLVDQGLPQQSLRLLPFMPCILTTLGEKGLLMTRLLPPGDDLLTLPESAPYILSRSTDGSATVGGVYMRMFDPAIEVLTDEILSVNGVGDTLIGTVIAGLAQENPKSVENLIEIAQRASVMTLKSTEAVSPDVASLQSALSI